MQDLPETVHRLYRVGSVSLKEGGKLFRHSEIFSLSVLCAGMVKGTNTALSVKKAVQFLSKAIHDTVLEGTDRNVGSVF